MEGADVNNKYHARKVEIDGYQFDSQAEARRYQELLLLEKAGKIARLVVHPRFVLQDSFVRPDGQRVNPITYKADFQYLERENGKVVTVVEDVKGGRATQTAAFSIRWRLFMVRYPRIDFRVVEA